MKSQKIFLALLMLSKSLSVLADEWSSDDDSAAEDFALAMLSGYALASYEEGSECNKMMGPIFVIGLFILVVMCSCGCIPEETYEEKYRRERRGPSTLLGFALGYALGSE